MYSSQKIDGWRGSDQCSKGQFFLERVGGPPPFLRIPAGSLRFLRLCLEASEIGSWGGIGSGFKRGSSLGRAGPPPCSRSCLDDAAMGTVFREHRASRAYSRVVV